MTAQTDHRAEQRRRIVRAAMACFSREGFHGTSMQQICAEAGMSPGALYRYFPSKESLIGAIVEGERAERACLIDSIETAPTFVDGLVTALEQLLRTPSTMAGAVLGPEIMAEAIRNEKLRDALEPAEAETRAMLERTIAGARARGEIDASVDLETLGLLLNAIGDGLLLHNLLHPEWKLAERTQAIATLVRRMMAPRETG